MGKKMHRVGVTVEEAEVICQGLLLLTKMQQTSLKQTIRIGEISQKFLAVLDEAEQEKKSDGD